jgi:hypothetical protein
MRYELRTDFLDIGNDNRARRAYQESAGTGPEVTVTAAVLIRDQVGTEGYFINPPETA